MIPRLLAFHPAASSQGIHYLLQSTPLPISRISLNRQPEIMQQMWAQVAVQLEAAANRHPISASVLIFTIADDRSLCGLHCPPL